MNDKGKLKNDSKSNTSSAFQLNETNFTSFDIANNTSVELDFPSEGMNIPETFGKKIGRCYVYCHTNGNPLIVIGPDCK